MDRPIVVSADQLDGSAQSTPGVHRSAAFADDHVWVGRVQNGPHQASGWHVHPGHDTYAYCVSGLFFTDFGPQGRERILIAPGAFTLIPKGVVHREGNAGDVPSEGVIVRVGSGPITVALEGPED